MVAETGDVFFSLLGVLRQIRTIQALDCSLRYVCSSWTLAHPVVSPRRAVAIHPQRIMYGTNTENRLPVSRLKATPPLPLLPTRGLYPHHPPFARDMVHIIIVVLVTSYRSTDYLTCQEHAEPGIRRLSVLLAGVLPTLMPDDPNVRGVQRLGRAGIRQFRPRGGHQNSPFRG